MKNSENLHIALVEYSPKWLDVSANLDYLSQLKFEEKTSLIILPEMFATGFCMDTDKITASDSEQIVNWMKDYSSINEKAIAGSVAINEDGKFYNRFYFFDKGNLVATYNKRHLFSYSGEDEKYGKGKERIIFEYAGWRICPQICYDLRFPVWFRNNEDFDILLNVANWPASRIHIWSNLLQARSIENMCYSIGVNRKGVDGNQLDYNGKSNVCFPSLEEMPLHYSDSIIYSILDPQKLMDYREKYPFLEDRDQFDLKP